jgi:putative spermidine/putrescine transport system permease protein
MRRERRRDLAGLGLLSPMLLVLLVAFLLPVASLVPTSLRPYIPGRGIGEGWTFGHYARAVTDPFYVEILLRTVGLGLVVTLLTLVVGYPLAYVLARSTSRWRHWLTLLVVFPLLLNLVVRTFGWIALLARRGLVNQWLIGLGVTEEPLRLMFNFTGLLIGLTHIFLPFMVLVLVAVIQNIPRDLEEAARVLGAGWWSGFRHVTLPLSAPGILSGSILVFVLTISALVTPRLLGGPTYKVISTLVYEQFLQLLDWPAGSAMALVMTAIVLLLILAGTLLARRWEARA